MWRCRSSSGNWIDPPNQTYINVYSPSSGNTAFLSLSEITPNPVPVFQLSLHLHHVPTPVHVLEEVLIKLKFIHIKELLIYLHKI